DRILYIGKSKIDKWTDIHGALANAGNTVLEVQISRAGVRHTVTVIPANRDGRTILGITAYVQVTPVSFTESLHMAADRCVAVIVGVGKGLMYIISGSPQGEVAGPIGIARIAGNVADTGILPLLLFIAILSLNLGVMNLLPIPLLDGGVIVLTVLEGLYGRKLPEKTLFYIQMAGIFILGGFFIYAMASDITALFR
ncbi:MAG: site-2 protease family protein, partial [Allisonella histaminiformans]